ncbi:MAG: SDR family oxidoreductase [Saprospiraceae bacterium]|nr:SDR family oxidoreductase [Saprospiraceae bacterium]
MNIIITGASRGIGLETAVLLAQNKRHQLLLLSRNTRQLELLKEEVLHHNIEFLPFDLLNPDSTGLVQKLESWDKVDVIINNAGKLVNKPFIELSSENWKEVYGVNVFGPAELIRTCLPWLEKSARAHVLNISSMGGFQGASKFPGLAAYSSSKAALASLTECLAEEFREKNIAVNCLALGAVQTEMLAEAFPGYEAPVSSEEMAAFVAYFAEYGHRFFNGKILPVALSTP